jgi:hypothetical protein
MVLLFLCDAVMSRSICERFGLIRIEPTWEGIVYKVVNKNTGKVYVGYEIMQYQVRILNRYASWRSPRARQYVRRGTSRQDFPEEFLEVVNHPYYEKGSCYSELLERMPESTIDQFKARVQYHKEQLGLI